MANGLTNAGSTDFDVSELLQNRSFLSAMSQLGAGIAGKDSIAGGLNALVQQNIGAKSQRELLSKLLKGGGKFTVDRDKIKIDAPSSAFGMEGQDIPSLLRGDTGEQPSLMSSTMPSTSTGITGDTGANQTTQPRQDLLNPSVSPADVRNVDLAGLTAKDVSQAFGLKLTADQLRQKTIVDISQASLREAQITKALRPEKETSAVETYKFAQRQGFKGSLKEFQTKATGHKKDYDTAVEGGYEGSFNDWMLAMARAGAINLGEFKERKETAAEVKQRAYFTSADFSSDVDKAVLARRSEYEASDDSTKAKSKIRFEEMERVVKTSFADATFGRDRKTGIVGWYDKGGELIASWQ